MAGHNKWKQIKHKKASTDAKRSQLFSKLVKEIGVAARLGGISPETNMRLRSALDKARALGLPKENMERAIERASGNGDGTELFEFLYEATGPQGLMVLIEGITDSKNRTHAELRKLASDHSFRLGEGGSVLWNFEKIGIIEIRISENSRFTKEDIELAAVDAGARDIETEEETLILETDFSLLEKVRKTLEDAGIAVAETKHDYKPRSLLAVSQENISVVQTFLESAENHDDVQNVYTNLAEQETI